MYQLLKWSLAVVFIFPGMITRGEELLKTERLPGNGVWVDPRIEKFPEDRTFHATVWLEEQFLGDGAAYLRRSKEFDQIGRSKMRGQVIATLKSVHAAALKSAGPAVGKLAKAGVISDPESFWIVNGFSCVTDRSGIRKLATEVPGVRKIFFTGPARTNAGAQGGNSKITPRITEVTSSPFDPEEYDPIWYIKALKADRVWKELGVIGKGTLNVIHDGNFVLSGWTRSNLYFNPNETVDRKDDDKNGLIDDVHGYDFARNSHQLTRRPESQATGRNRGPVLHGHQCVGIICGRASKNHPVQPGIAPESRWAGVLASRRIEAAVQWAIEHGADTYSMSFSRPNMADARSHWRKIMEHGAFCGVHFVSGAGNFARKGSPGFAPVPVQMRVPEDIPNAVFAAAGVQQDLSRTPFSSQGPVEWKTEHYQEGRVDKPEVCAFNFRIPLLDPKGGRPTNFANGNSFAGPMYCGTIALILSANPELKPWETREIIIKTATDIAEPGFDFQTGHGLINAFEAVKLARNSASL